MVLHCHSAARTAPIPPLPTPPHRRMQAHACRHTHTCRHACRHRCAQAPRHTHAQLQAWRAPMSSAGLFSRLLMALSRALLKAAVNAAFPENALLIVLFEEKGGETMGSDT